jgi:HPt (histidine-containing phosphotransfer) domain-containing protein
MDDYVAKPVRLEELAAALGRVRRDRDGAGANGSGLSLEADTVKGLLDLGGEEFLGEVIAAFLEDAPALVAALRASREQGNAEELRRSAHSLKSNGQIFGATRFADLCRELEERAKRSELDGASDLVNRIEQEYGALESALVDLRAQAAS